jgi:hypothetical protein
MIIVIVCLRLTQQDDIDRFYTSMRVISSSIAPNVWLITQQLSSNAEVPRVYLPTSNVGETKGIEGVGAKRELAKLTSISGAQEKCSSSV